MNKFSILGLALILSSAFSVEAGRRNPSPSENPAAIIYFKEKNNTKPIAYDVLQASRSLHREALYAFHQGQYEHARTCFSLALKASPKSEDLMLNYALFSMVVPWMEGRSLTRAQGLIEQVQSPRFQNDPRYALSQEIYHWLSQKEPVNTQRLQNIRHPYYGKVSKGFLQHLQNRGELVPLALAKKCLPLRTASRDKRSRR